jgi:tetratricopeptide (TPR) repeat protein
MRYVPDLIPNNSKVLKDYFKGNPYTTNEQTPLITALGWIFGSIFIIVAIAFILHPLMTLILGLLGSVLIPPINQWLEQKLRFKFTTKIKAVFCAVLFIISIPLKSHYNKIDTQIAYQLDLKTKEEQKVKAENEKKEQIRKDSLDYYILASNKFTKEHKTDDALKQLTYAASFATIQSDKERITKEQINISSIKTFDLVKAGKYQKAIPELNNLIAQDVTNSDLLYNRAICYSKTGKIQEAVNDCKAAIQLSNKDAEKLHDKINPIKKRVSYYITRCCDGGTSNAKGRGACSGHGGVCNWNEPVYEEYRKY